MQVLYLALKSREDVFFVASAGPAAEANRHCLIDERLTAHLGLHSPHARDLHNVRD